MKLAPYVLAVLGLTISVSVFAVNSDPAAIDTLQKQITSVQTEMHQALAAQQATTQKAITDLQTQVQGQLAHIQTEMQQMQAQLTNEIKQVQNEAIRASSAPVVTATPGVTTPAK